MALAVSSYVVVQALHIMAVLLAFGLPLAYPLLVPWTRRHPPPPRPGLHDAQSAITQRLAGPATAALLAFGAHRARKNHYCDAPWVIVPLAIVGVIILVGLPV